MTAVRPRSALGAELSARLRDGRLALPECAACGAVNYPPQPFCRTCLGPEVHVVEHEAITAQVVAAASVHRSYAEDFASGGPWPVVTVQLDGGDILMAHALEPLPAGTNVQLVALTDALGDGVFGAVRSMTGSEALQRRFSAGSAQP